MTELASNVSRTVTVADAISAGQVDVRIVIGLGPA
jgi:hypothetical protein